MSYRLVFSDSVFLTMERNIDLVIGQVSVPLKIPLLSAKIWLQKARQVNNKSQTQIVTEWSLVSVNPLQDTRSESQTSGEYTLAETRESSDTFTQTKDHISRWRLILLVLKRLCSTGKSWLKEDKVDSWLKFILHGTYLMVLESIYVFIYILHFFRAFLTLIKYFTDQDNKNFVEAYKFLYACFKIFISVLMLALMGVMIAHGISPFSVLAYQHFKILFYLYGNSKLIISAITLGLSYCKAKTYNNNSDHAWLTENYRSNFKKHVDILLVAGPITISLLLISFGLVTGPWFYVALGIASVFLLIDALKAIYYYNHPNKIPEPEAATLPQQNPFIDFSNKDYYYRKCRIARLKVDDIESNRIYLLKEIIVKLLQINIKLNESSFSRFSFFSEKKKLIEKIEGLKQAASSLLTDDYQKNQELLQTISNALYENHQEAKNEKKILIPMESDKVKKYLKTIIIELPHARDRFRDKTICYSQLFRQSFFRSISDSVDIEKACQAFREMQANTLKMTQ